MRSAIALLLLVPAALPAADVFRGPGHQTVLREQDTDHSGIRTIYQDVHAPMVEVISGMGMVDDLQLSIRGTTERAWWSGLDDGQRDRGRQSDADVLIRGRAASWLTLELEGGAVVGDFPDHYDFRNLDVRAAVSLFQERYRGAALVVGGALPVSTTGSVPGYDHRADVKRWSYIAELRWTESLGFHVFTLNLGGRFAPNVENTFPDGLTVDGQALPAGDEVRNNTVSAVGRLGWSWRPDPLGRIGAEYVGTLDRFEFSSSTNLTNHHQTVIGFLEVDPEQSLAIQVFAGVGLEPWSANAHGSSLVAGGQLRFGF